jgi:hypothetical protein
MAANDAFSDIIFWKATPPRREDVLFSDIPEDSRDNAYVSLSGGDNGFGYTEGYLRGARLLVEKTLAGLEAKDLLVYPIVFLYRHHIELVLKSILRRAVYVVDFPLTGAEEKCLSSSHNLDQLWQYVKPRFAAVCDSTGWENLSLADESGITSYVNQLTRIDARSYCFRYPLSTKGRPSLPFDLKRFNLRHFAELMDRLAEYLNSLDAQLSLLEDWNMENAANLRP